MFKEEHIPFHKHMVVGHNVSQTQFLCNKMIPFINSMGIWGGVGER